MLERLVGRNPADGEPAGAGGRPAPPGIGADSGALWRGRGLAQRRRGGNNRRGGKARLGQVGLGCTPSPGDGEGGSGREQQQIVLRPGLSQRQVVVPRSHELRRGDVVKFTTNVSERPASHGAINDAVAN